jgi:hypothetical protein
MKAEADRADKVSAADAGGNSVVTAARAEADAATGTRTKAEAATTSLMNRRMRNRMSGGKEAGVSPPYPMWSDYRAWSGEVEWMPGGFAVARGTRGSAKDKLARR